MSLMFDVAVPLNQVPDFIDRASAGLKGLAPTARLAVVGHLGDDKFTWSSSSTGRSGAHPASPRPCCKPCARRFMPSSQSLVVPGAPSTALVACCWPRCGATNASRNRA
jgi:hypothetical protein